MRSVSLLLAGLLLAPVAWAQESREAERNAPAELLSPRQILERLEELPRALDLDGRQRDEYRELYRTFAEKFRGERDEPRDARRERRAEEDPAEQRARLDRLARQHIRRAEAVGGFLKQVGGMLDDEQRAALAPLRAELVGPTSLETARVLVGLRPLEQDLELQGRQQRAFDRAARALRQTLDGSAAGEALDEEAILAEVEEAVASGDTERLKAIGKKHGRAPVDVSAAVETFVRALSPDLREPQREVLDEFRASVLVGKSGRARDELREMFAAARGCDLSSEQSVRLDEIEARAGEALHNGGEAGEAVAEARRKVLDLLERGQRRQFREQLRAQRQERRGGPRIDRAPATRRNAEATPADAPSEP